VKGVAIRHIADIVSKNIVVSFVIVRVPIGGFR